MIPYLRKKPQFGRERVAILMRFLDLEPGPIKDVVGNCLWWDSDGRIRTRAAGLVDLGEEDAEAVRLALMAVGYPAGAARKRARKIRQYED